jgi:hypothetical protein
MIDNAYNFISIITFISSFIFQMYNEFRTSDTILIAGFGVALAIMGFSG